MLGSGTMSRTALALVLVAASASAASAGGFVGLGIGTGPATSGDFNIDEDGRSGRLMVGYRIAAFSIEGLGTRYDMRSSDGHDWTGTTLAIAARYNFALGDRFEAFARAGLVRTDVNAKEYDEELSGSGFLVGGGFEYRLTLAGTGVSAFVDYTIQRNTLKLSYNGQDQELTHRLWTLGGIVSF